MSYESEIIPPISFSRHTSHLDFKGIDILKLVMAFAVIAIHEPEYLWPDNRTYPEAFHWFIRLAVPFFIIASGFLIQGKVDSIDSNAERSKFLRLRSMHIFRIWCIWLLLYLPLTIYGEIHSTEPLRTIVLRYVESVVFTGRSLYAQPLWFLYVMAIVFFIWSFVVRSSAAIGMVIVFFLSALFELYINIQPENYSLQSLGCANYFIMLVLEGGGSVAGGALYRIFLHKRGYSLQLSVGATSLCVSMLLYCYDISLFAFFGGLGVFTMSFIVGKMIKRNLIALRYQSMWIFYTHMYVIIAFMIVMRQCDLSGNRWLLLILVCLTSWCLASLLNRLSNHPKFHKLKYLIK